jgi:Predicted membrane protein
VTHALWCVLIAGLLPYLGAVSAKLGGRFSPAANHRTRDWLESLQGWPRRAHWFQLNSFEAFPFFAAAVIVAQMLHAPQTRVDALAEAFIAFRLAFYVCFLADWAVLRSLAWTGGMVCTVWLFLLVG